MWTINRKLCVLFGLPCHVSDTETADVVITTGRDKNCVEISQADWAVVLENFALIRVISWVKVSHLNIFLVDVSLDSYLVTLSNLRILNSFMSSSPIVSFLVLWIDNDVTKSPILLIIYRRTGSKQTTWIVAILWDYTLSMTFWFGQEISLFTI